MDVLDVDVVEVAEREGVELDVEVDVAGTDELAVGEGVDVVEIEGVCDI